MRDIVFLVADGEMQATVEGFFENQAFDARLQCARFEFDTKQDLIKHPRKDPGVYQDGHNLLKSYVDTHNYAVVMVDFAFNDNLQTMNYQQFCTNLKATTAESTSVKPSSCNMDCFDNWTFNNSAKLRLRTNASLKETS